MSRIPNTAQASFYKTPDIQHHQLSHQTSPYNHIYSSSNSFAYKPTSIPPIDAPAEKPVVLPVNKLSPPASPASDPPFLAAMNPGSSKQSLKRKLSDEEEGKRLRSRVSSAGSNGREHEMASYIMPSQSPIPPPIPPATSYFDGASTQYTFPSDLPVALADEYLRFSPLHNPQTDSLLDPTEWQNWEDFLTKLMVDDTPQQQAPSPEKAVTDANKPTGAGQPISSASSSALSSSYNAAPFSNPLVSNSIPPSVPTGPLPLHDTQPLMYGYPQTPHQQHLPLQLSQGRPHNFQPSPLLPMPSSFPPAPAPPPPTVVDTKSSVNMNRRASLEGEIMAAQQLSNLAQHAQQDSLYGRNAVVNNRPAPPVVDRDQLEKPNKHLVGPQPRDKRKEYNPVGASMQDISSSSAGKRLSNPSINGINNSSSSSGLGSGGNSSVISGKPSSPAALAHSIGSPAAILSVKEPEQQPTPSPVSVKIETTRPKRASAKKRPRVATRRPVSSDEEEEEEEADEEEPEPEEDDDDDDAFEARPKSRRQSRSKKASAAARPASRNRRGKRAVSQTSSGLATPNNTNHTNYNNEGDNSNSISTPNNTTTAADQAGSEEASGSESVQVKSENNDGPVNPRGRGGRNSQSAASKRRSGRDLLTEDEKRANHIASEQKRRDLLRNGFASLVDLVPGLKGGAGGSSKSLILERTVEFIRNLEARNEELVDVVASLERRVGEQSK
ncbi:hypothetical protein SmJEL517_g00382 [Synchytrium microbalum]|uniref:BHLH domain-containing protein n=1 Tax=Synchytrium microbalum TaxID=1806994 RepID=A0A507CGB8_9FUNG|nr:uncharacterized protein SmJEL517_g00382 [Synchytrium microbalum]TPX38249.1 hypothetical protein SmJEL517_g00382 [Synchytrium microbalum]